MAFWFRRTRTFGYIQDTPVLHSSFFIFLLYLGWIFILSAEDKHQTVPKSQPVCASWRTNNQESSRKYIARISVIPLLYDILASRTAFVNVPSDLCVCVCVCVCVFTPQ